jgi:hypothetical protein
MRILATKPPTTTEDDVQTTIADGLKALGYTVLSTTHRSRGATCPKCGTFARPKKGYGADLGVPDLLVTHKKWPAGAMLGIEVKKPVGWHWTTPEQQALWESGRTAKAHSWEQACYAVFLFERRSLGWSDCLRLEIEETQKKMATPPSMVWFEAKERTVARLR